VERNPALHLTGSGLCHLESECSELFLHLALTALQLGAAVPAAEQTARLEIKVQDVSKRGGDVRLGLYDQTSWTNDRAEPVAGAVVPAISPQTIITLRNLKPGTFGVKLFQDYNCGVRFHLARSAGRKVRLLARRPGFPA
jgi:uncharacterized protein (DUF2141 family)